MTKNWPNLSKIGQKFLKLFETILNCLKLSKIQIALSCQKLSDFVQTCLMVRNVKGYIWLSTKIVPNGLNDSSGIKFTAKWIWDSFIFSSIKPKLDMGSFVDFCVFTWIWLNLPDQNLKLFCRSKQNNFMSTSCKNW